MSTLYLSKSELYSSAGQCFCVTTIRGKYKGADTKGLFCSEGLEFSILL